MQSIIEGVEGQAYPTILREVVAGGSRSLRLFGEDRDLVVGGELEAEVEPTVLPRPRNERQHPAMLTGA